MGKIRTSTINRYGIKRTTVVQTNRLEELTIELARYFGRDRQWRLIHFIEKRKLKRQ